MGKGGCFKVRLEISAAFIRGDGADDHGEYGCCNREVSREGGLDAGDKVKEAPDRRGVGMVVATEV